MSEKKPLTERQQKFVDAIVGEAGGDIRAAMDIAGYSKHTTIKEAVEPVKDHIVEAAQMMIAMNAPKAAVGLTNVITDPSALGARNVVAAAREVLDRAGVVKRETLEVKGPEGGIFILPPKQEA
jgi:phage terminase small subunit